MVSKISPARNIVQADGFWLGDTSIFRSGFAAFAQPLNYMLKRRPPNLCKIWKPRAKRGMMFLFGRWSRLLVARLSEGSAVNPAHYSARLQESCNAIADRSPIMVVSQKSPTPSRWPLYGVDGAGHKPKIPHFLFARRSILHRNDIKINRT